MAKGELLRFELDDDDLKLFSEEADDQLALLDAALVRLESDADADLVQGIFRAAHTLKGSSATIGHRKMASLTHAMESVLDAVRQGRQAPTPRMVDILLAALDVLRVLAAEVTTRVDAGIETAEIERALMGLIDADGAGEARPEAPRGGTAEPVLPPHALDQARRLQDEGRAIVLAGVAIAPDCQLPGIRCFQVLQELEGLGTVMWTEPARAVVEAGGADFALRVLLATDAGMEAVQGAVGSIADVGMVSVTTDVPGAPKATSEVKGPSLAAPRTPGLSVIEGQRDSGSRVPRGTAQSVRIDVERLDGLMNLVGELVIDRTRLQQIREQLAGVLKDANLSELTENFEETTTHLARITDELQEEIMRSRMLPVRSVLSRLPRLVRDVAARCGKKVELVTAGEETELDRSVIEEISDPLVHILRNAIDHGIEAPEQRRATGKAETGIVRVTAWNQEAYIYLAVSDDGAGIDTDALRRKAVERGLVNREAAEAASDEAVLQYIFLPGLSTARQISDVSGRGVGMDIVRTNIERLNGQVTVRSTRGQGSEIVIQLPLTLATTKALMVVANETVYAIPLVSVTEALTAEDADLHPVGGRQTLRLRGQLIPVVELSRALGDLRPAGEEAARFVVAAHHGARQVAFLVDRLLGEQDVVVKSLGDVIGARGGLTGATILGDGTLGLIVDTASLVTEQGQLAATA